MDPRLRAETVRESLVDLLGRMDRYTKEHPVEDWTLTKVSEAKLAQANGDVEQRIQALHCLTICIRRETEGKADWPEYKRALHTLTIYG